MSHLLQMRGLKPYVDVIEGLEEEVASFTDAWIETKIDFASANAAVVASFTDAWIET